jgi:membrane protein implicated in regulation of membrane protease activity
MLIVIAIILLLLVLPAPIGIAVLALAVVAEFGEAVFWRRALRRYRIRSGAEAMIGRMAVVSETCRPEGAVRFDGAIWKAHCEAGAGIGDEVRVLRLDGLTLHVEPSGAAR